MLQTSCCSMGEERERRLRHLTGTWKQGTTTLVGVDVACTQGVPTLGQPLSLASHSEPTAAPSLTSAQDEETAQEFGTSWAEAAPHSLLTH